MDKSTLSSYGWVVIVTLVLVVMLALATPFGDYVGSAVVSTVKGYGSANEKAIDEDNIKTKSDRFGEKLGKFGTSGGEAGSTTLQDGATFCKYFDGHTYIEEPATLTWEQLKDPANEKYGYDSSLITDTSIGGTAFYYCESLTSVTIPNGVTSIGIGAFSYCSSLTSVIIPNSVTSMGYRAFEYCSSLTSVTISNSVTSIGNDTFSNCTSLTNINFQGTKAQWNAITKASSWNNSTGNYTIHCTDGDISK